MNELDQAKRALNHLSSGEWAIFGGAAWILVVDFIIGNRITQDYFSSVSLIVAPLALGVLAALFVKHGGQQSPSNSLYPSTLNAASVGIVVFAALDLLNGIVNEFSSSGEFYEITLYIAAATILAGMMMMRQSSDVSPDDATDGLSNPGATRADDATPEPPAEQ